MKILLAIDGSESSEAAVHAVAARPWPAGSTVRVLSVAQPVYPPANPLFPEVGVSEEYKQVTERVIGEAKRLTGDLADVLGRNKAVTVETAVRQGDPRVEIVGEAEDWSANLVIVGSHGRTGVKRWLMGSVAEYVVRHAPCSVEVARAIIKSSGEPGK
jgi:nucleotide-binding universal stress UspA family protein